MENAISALYAASGRVLMVSFGLPARAQSVLRQASFR